MNRRYLLQVTLALLVLMSWPSHASRADDTVTDQDAIEIVFDELERVIIEEYFGDANGNKRLPPGLAKRDQLPPGLARQVQRNGTLPPGLRTYEFPPELIVRLPPPVRGTRRVIVGNDVILIREGTRYVLDVIKDVLTE